MLLCWRGLRTDAPPPARKVREWKSSGAHKNLLCREAVNAILGTSSNWHKGSAEHQSKKRRKESYAYEDEEDWRECDQGGTAIPSDEEDLPEEMPEEVVFLMEEPSSLTAPSHPSRPHNPKPRPVSAALGAPSKTPPEAELNRELWESVLEMQQKTQATLEFLLEERNAEKRKTIPEVVATTMPQAASSHLSTQETSHPLEADRSEGRRKAIPGVAATTTPQAAIPPPVPPTASQQLPGETLNERRLRSLGESQQCLGSLLGLEPPTTPAVLEEEGVSCLCTSAQQETLQQQIEFPLPMAIREVWNSARQPKVRMAEIPIAVRQCYRMTPQDWAFLGAVRRPDEALLPYCKGKYRDSTKGPVLAHKDKGLERLESLLSDTITDTTHAVRPVALTFSAANQASQLLSTVRDHLISSAAPQNILDAVDSAKQCAVLAVEGSVDAADCLAQQNAVALRSLRQAWVEASTLPENTKKQVLNTALAGGIPLVDKS